MNPAEENPSAPRPFEPASSASPPLAGIAREPSFQVVLDNIRSAFNVGSIFRTADACGAERLWLCGMTACPPHPRLARAALGAEQAVPWTHCRRAEEALDALAALGVTPVALEIAGSAACYADFDWPPPGRLALVAGHETRGVAPGVLARCPAVVRIPMFGAKNSLNVATAAGVVMYEILRRWGRLARPPQGVQQGFLSP
jgi:tRNA G18 (ribose-2'-O)-methylase SpoU